MKNFGDSYPRYLFVGAYEASPEAWFNASNLHLHDLGTNRGWCLNPEVLPLD